MVKESKRSLVAGARCEAWRVSFFPSCLLASLPRQSEPLAGRECRGRRVRTAQGQQLPISQRDGGQSGALRGRVGQAAPWCVKSKERSGK